MTVLQCNNVQGGVVLVYGGNLTIDRKIVDQ